MNIDVPYKVLDERVRANPIMYNTVGASAMDLRAMLDAPYTLESDETILVGTGIAIDLTNPSYSALVIPRSGIGHNHGIVLGNLVGLIDSDYQGEIKVSLWNRGHSRYIIAPLDRVAQLMFVPNLRATLYEVCKFTESARGDRGLGSTGVA